MNKLALIIDSSEAFISFQKDFIIKEWGFDSYERVEDLSQVGNNTLFGPVLPSILDLESGEQTKKVLSYLKSSNLEKLSANGLIITSALNRNTTKALQNYFKTIGTVYLPPTGKVTLTQRIVRGYMSLNKVSEEFLLNYLGDDYDAAIPLARALSELSKEEQAKITVEELFYRLPKAPGSVPPWEIEEPLFKKDSIGTIDKYRRIARASHAVLPVSIINKKLRLMFQCAVILEENPRASLPSIAKTLGVPNNYPLKLAVGKARTLGVDKLERLSLLFAGVEHKIKGGSGANVDTIVELSLLEAIEILK